ncbi:DUF6443 domain-containing protein [Mucilaginibacter phyllosphaerae]|uniref:RHS repeat-associated protein n=1 Tax=Mucilaginibacter phyllosphaerae TaxID=1812349 RepID=A0A4Y8AD75_9SPHI|nr:DUF6443 domain-containing protein [Mucilaginibacter phyllosphaerae]MBB3969318.1 RHS repeat-associated protein [Mucilaginibacter phyllosphaerae]TEW65888.1 hypothetical protein E2R65_12195 [Mucilaginibacter phyllosphaerae]GGH07661.1 hypothetical protein GCM10007352_12510 [Mucilaginibacter phyllosphaerae]
MKIRIKKLNAFILYSTLLFVNTIYNATAQTIGFMQKDVIKNPGSYTDAQITTMPLGEKQTTRSYYDGLGQTIQTVAIKGSPMGYDIIQPYAYNNLGQQTTKYLPYVGTNGSGAYRPNALTLEQAAFYNNGLADKIADDTKPYSQVLYSDDPLQQLLSAGSIGNGYEIGGHNAIFDNRSNNSSDGNIIMWSTAGINIGNYTATLLNVKTATNEDGVKAATFTDFAGHLVLKREYAAAANTCQDTYYIYNNAGQVSMIIPPKALELMVSAGNYSLTQTGVNNLIFKYVYDNHGRVIQKTVPGSGTINTIYDPLNRPVLVQNAQMAVSYKWYYIKYDVKDHPISQGIYTDPNQYGAAAMQNAVNSNTTYNTSWYEIRNTNQSTGYYSNSTFPLAGIKPLSYNYYDYYDMDLSGMDDYSYSTQGLAGESTPTTAPTRGILTMTRKTTLGNGFAAGNWLVSYIFYDKKGKAIQLKSNNQLTAAVSDIKTNVFDAFGLAKQTKVTKVVNSVSTTVLTTMGYDPMNRLQTVDQSYNGATAIRIAAYIYNELGQLIDKKLHSTDGGNSYLQSVDYRYNIRGQLISMNNSKIQLDWGNGTTYTNDDNNDLFGMQMLYDQADSNLGNTAYYSGRLSAIKWMNKITTTTNSYERSYKYGYDEFNRYKTAAYAERAPGGTLYNKNSGGFSEAISGYDVNGNIQGLTRRSSTQGTTSDIQIDNLTYVYYSDNPNKLKSVTDGTGTNYTGAGFRNLTGVVPGSTSGNYLYDTNGNLTTDPFKGLTLTYNDLNKTNVITITAGTNRHIDYTYDAAGSVIRKQQYDNTNPVVTTDYVDGFVYIGSTISFFPMPEGRVNNTGSSLKPEYLINDQQGNARLSFEESTATPGTAVVKQENSYYATGQIMANSPVATPSAPNKNLYNGGSEWQNDYNNQPDYQQTFYRNYDAAIARFVASDPMAELTESMSVYQYANNNPVMMNDPMGNSARAGSQISYQHDNPYVYSMYAEGSNGGSWFASALFDMNDAVFDGYASNVYHVNSDGSTSGAWAGNGREHLFYVDGKYMPDATGKNGKFYDTYSQLQIQLIDINGLAHTDWKDLSEAEGIMLLIQNDVDINANQGGTSGFGKTNDVINTISPFLDMKTMLIEGGVAASRNIRITAVEAADVLRATSSRGIVKYLGITKGLGIAGSVVTTGYSSYQVYGQYQKGGVNEVFSHRDVVDAGVGAIGLGATGLAAFGLISNPVGWTIGAGILVYSVGTLIYDATHKEN